MINDAARLRANETESDALGQRSAAKSRHSVGASTPESGYEPKQLPADHQTEIFARDIMHFLRASHQQGRFDKLFLVASPEFLGVLRKQLGAELRDIVALQINKDYTRLQVDELRELIQTHGGGE
jgi:protein required for attachment to host cells